MHALADSYIAVKQTDKAVRILERMILLFPNDPYCFFDLGIIYLENKLYNNGLDYLQHSLKLAPDNPVIYYNIAGIYKETGQDNLAVDIYMQALLRNPKLTVDFWNNVKLLLDLDIPLEFKYEILSFGAEYGDENAKKVLEEKTWLMDEEEE
jgi:tetratricopeptide (TPR) repeat protein